MTIFDFVFKDNSSQCSKFYVEVGAFIIRHVDLVHIIGHPWFLGRDRLPVFFRFLAGKRAFTPYEGKVKFNATILANLPNGCSTRSFA